MRRPFFVWVGDVFCGLSAYVLSRWVWQKHGDGVFANLPQELATFAGAYVLLKLVFKSMGAARTRRHEAKTARRLLERAAGRTP